MTIAWPENAEKRLIKMVKSRMYIADVAAALSKEFSFTVSYAAVRHKMRRLNLKGLAPPKGEKWTEAMVEDLKRMVLHHPAREIAEALSQKYKIRITRNSVVGKCNRSKIKLEGGVRGGAAGTRSNRRRPKRQKVLSNARGAETMTDTGMVHKKRRIRLTEAERDVSMYVDIKNSSITDIPISGCKWIYGDVKKGTARWCRHAPTVGSSCWCDKHFKIVYPNGNAKVQSV